MFLKICIIRVKNSNVHDMKSFKIYIKKFRVPRKGMSGLPYLRRDLLTFLDMHIKSKHFLILFKEK